MKDFGPNLTPKMPSNWANLVTSGVHFYASAAKPARHGSRKAPRPPKTPSRPQSPLFFYYFCLNFNTFLDTLSSECDRPFFWQLCNAASVRNISIQIVLTIFATRDTVSSKSSQTCADVPSSQIAPHYHLFATP